MHRTRVQVAVAISMKMREFESECGKIMQYCAQTLYLLEGLKDSPTDDLRSFAD